MKRNAIADLLNRTGMTRSELAAQLGVTPSAISHYLSGRKSVSAARAVEVERSTRGRIRRRDLRPDLFG